MTLLLLKTVSMSATQGLTPFPSSPPKPKSHHRVSLLRYNRPTTRFQFQRPKLISLPKIRALNGKSEPFPVLPEKPRWENVLNTAASLYPLYVTVGGIVACLKPSAFAWFVKARPTSYSLSLGLIMLSMGLTLKFKDFIALFSQRPLAVCLALCSKWSLSI